MGAFAIGVAALAILYTISWSRQSQVPASLLTGAVLRQDKDPKEQSPIANAQIVASSGKFQVNAVSDASGLFKVSLPAGLSPLAPLAMTFKHADYKTVDVERTSNDRLYIVRMEPLKPDPSAPQDSPAPANPVLIKDVHVRYTAREQTTMIVGSIAKQFQVPNAGNLPCSGAGPCSPDRKWKASVGSVSVKAEGDTQFRNVSITCIAGPCPFTSIMPGDLSRPVSVINASVLNWSDTTAFLVEAEVIRTAFALAIHRSYPTLIGRTMTFTLPAAAEGLTFESELNGEAIIFPLGPKLTLSWAFCSAEAATGQNKTYRCELKPGYRFFQ